MDQIDKRAQVLRNSDTRGLVETAFGGVSALFRRIAITWPLLHEDLMELRSSYAKLGGTYSRFPDNKEFKIPIAKNISLAFKKHELDHPSISQKLIRSAQLAVIDQLDNYLKEYGYTRKDYFEILKLKKETPDRVEGTFRGAYIYLHYSSGGGPGDLPASSSGFYSVKDSARTSFNGSEAFQMWNLIKEVKGLQRLLNSSLAMESKILISLVAEIQSYSTPQKPPPASELFNLK